MRREHWLILVALGAANAVVLLAFFFLVVNSDLSTGAHPTPVANLTTQSSPSGTSPAPETALATVLPPAGSLLQTAPIETLTIELSITPADTPTPVLAPSLTASPVPSLAPMFAQVAPNGGGLRLRQTPGTTGNVLKLLDADTPLTVIGRTDDNSWLQVTLASGDSGWVMTKWLQTSVRFAEIPVTGAAVEVSATPQSNSNPPTNANTRTAQVSVNSGGVKVRQTPGTAGIVIDLLGVGTSLTVIGRTADNSWLQVTLPSGVSGWVITQWLDTSVHFADLPVTGKAVEATATPTAAPASNPPPAGSSGPDPSYITGMTSRARQIYLSGLQMGNQANVFSLVGDSNTDNPAFFAPFDSGNYNLGSYTYLQDTISYFQGSFGRDSVAAVGSFNTSKELDPAYADGRCNGGESPLVCEYRLNRPSVALILLGTGDQHAWTTFEGRYRQIIDYTINHGIVPVLITKADDLESTDNTAPHGYINAIIVRLSAEYQIPLLNLRQVVEPLPNHGCVADGFHYNTPPDGQSANFTGDHLLYGYPMRNLTALQVLYMLRRYVMY